MNKNIKKIENRFTKRKRVVEDDFSPSKSDLPILSYKDDLISKIQSFKTTIVVGETGSGKSTQLPQFISELPDVRGVVCTQPRRVAAVTIAQRVADERNCEVGDEVGYSIRFDDRSSKRTRIKYVTDGVLLREMISDPELSRYSVVILDEAHERSLQTDILMGLLRRLQDRRTDIRVVIMSATLEVDLFMTFFKVCLAIANDMNLSKHLTDSSAGQDAAFMRVQGRQYPVQIMYTVRPQESYMDAALQTCMQVISPFSPLLLIQECD